MKQEQDNLQEAIVLLQKRQAIELRELKSHLHEMHENLKPINILKNAIHQVTSAPDIKETILDNVIGLATGYVSKKLFVGTSHNLIKQFLGVLVQTGVTNVASKNADSIKSVGEKIFQFVFKDSKKDKLKSTIADN